MRLNNPITVRQQWYDRNPLPITFEYIAITGPHGLTTRWTYAVPANRVARIAAVTMITERHTAAAPVAEVTMYVRFNPLGVGGPAHLAIRHVDNTPWQWRFASGFNGFIMRATDELQGQTSDSSAGGTNFFSLTIDGTEYDA